MTEIATAAATSIANAIKACGSIVKVEPAEFESIILQGDGLLVVIAPAGFFARKFRYLTNYKGLTFFAQSSSPLRLPEGTEVIIARTIWIPG